MAEETEQQQDEQKQESGINPNYQLPLIPFNVTNPGGTLQFGQVPAATATAPAPAVPFAAPQATEAAKVAPAAPQTPATPAPAHTAKPAPAPGAPVTYAQAEQQVNPWANLGAKASNIQNPILKALARIGVGAGAGAEGLSKEYPQIEAGREGAAKEIMNQPLEWAKSQAELAAANKAANKSPWEPVGEAKFNSQTGKMDQEEKNIDTGETGIFPVGTTPGAAPKPPASFVAPPPSAAGAAPAAAPVNPYAPPKEDQQPASASQMADYQAALNSPYITDDQRKLLTYPDGTAPTQKDITERLAQLQRANEDARQGKRDEAEDALKKLTTGIAQQNSDLRKETEEDKLNATAQTNASQSDSAYNGLYAQDNYREKQHSFYDSGHFAKDSGLIAEQLGGKGGEGVKGGIGTGLGLLTENPYVAGGAAAVDAVAGLFGKTLDGYLDTLKKQGISDDGYKAMQAYRNALLGRLMFDAGQLKGSTSILRLREVADQILAQVPPPNTPQSVFDSSMDEYYNPMKSQVVRPNKFGRLPSDYQPPKYRDYYPETKAPAAAGGEKTPAQGAAGKVHANFQDFAHIQSGSKGTAYSDDGKTWYDQSGNVIGGK